MHPALSVDALWFLSSFIIILCMHGQTKGPLNSDHGSLFCVMGEWVLSEHTNCSHGHSVMSYILY